MEDPAPTEHGHVKTAVKEHIDNRFRILSLPSICCAEMTGFEAVQKHLGELPAYAVTFPKLASNESRSRDPSGSVQISECRSLATAGFRVPIAGYGGINGHHPPTIG